ncbi:MAG TPA: fructosamine kinase family protein [Mycobacteriales bacterium]|nr:fructosamine kinase family protein [Mycobacteriales bacterium]
MDTSERVTALLRIGVNDATPYGRAITGERWRLRLADGREVFVKARADAPDGFFAVEAAGLEWLGSAPGGPPVPPVLGHDRRLLVLPWLPEEAPAPAAIEQLGRELAALHASGSPVFGNSRDGWIGAAALPNEPAPTWAEFYATRRVLPYVRELRDQGRITPAEVGLFERLAARLPELAGAPEPPARIHGDLWSGNVLFSGGRGWLVDPAAHGGHRETDLAMLTLFGESWVPRLLAAYEEAAVLADGWRERRPLHQVHPLLVHAVLFGASYLAGAVEAAETYD